jgi:hypothetical protein
MVLALSQSARAGDINPYLPNDSDIVMALDFARFADASMVKKHLPKLMRDHVGDLIQAISAIGGPGAGFMENSADDFKQLYQDVEENRRLLREISESGIVMYAAGNMSAGDEEVLLVYHGKFDNAKVAEFLAFAAKVRPMGISVQEQRAANGKYYTLKLPGEQAPWYLAMPDERNLVVSPAKHLVLDTLSKAAGTLKSRLSPEVSSLLAKVDTRQSAWLAAAPQDENVTGFHGGIHFEAGITINMTVIAKDAATSREIASEFNDGWREAREILVKQVKGSPELSLLVRAFGTAQAKATGSTVSFKCEIPAIAVEQALEYIDRTFPMAVK